MKTEDILKQDFYDFCGVGAAWMDNNAKIKYWREIIEGGKSCPNGVDTGIISDEMPLSENGERISMTITEHYNAEGKMTRPGMKQKSLAQLKKDLTKVFNAWIRKRDSLFRGQYFKCISCQELKPTTQMHAGHFYAAGNFSAIRWDEDNCHGQCVKCNTFLHGNLLEYRKGLLAKIGEERLTRLEIRRHNESKMGRFELETLIKKYK